MKLGAGFVSFLISLALLPGSPRAQDSTRVLHEGLVQAPVDKVWAAFTTSEGLESWMTAHARVDLKVGGSMRTQYDPKGTVDDSTAIENTILSYEPMGMLSFKVAQAPKGFPFPHAITKKWTVVYFVPQGDKATRVREVSMGFATDDESKQMREFFDRGNALTLQELEKRFTPKATGK